ncbi:MAG: Rne/Rng family ribonuclease [Acidimicrobiia bacterium]
MDESTTSPDAADPGDGQSALPADVAASIAEPRAAERSALRDDVADSEGADGGEDGVDVAEDATDDATEESAAARAAKKRRRGSRGGRRRKPSSVAPGGGEDVDDSAGEDDRDESDEDDGDVAASGADADAPAPAKRPPVKRAPRSDGAIRAGDEQSAAVLDSQPELPERATEGRVHDAEIAERALVPRAPRIGDTRPAPPAPHAPPGPPPAAAAPAKAGAARAKGPAQRPPRGKQASAAASAAETEAREVGDADAGGDKKKRRRPERQKRGPAKTSTLAEIDPDVLERRRGKERNGRPVGRYLMCVQARESLTQVAVLEGRSLIEHYVSRPADDISQIHGNIYLGRVQNVLPGMEAAFVDISTPKNAVLYRGDVQYDSEDIVERGDKLRIEQMLKSRQMIVSQVTKNPIGAKGARLTQEVSLPGRFVVLIPNSKTYGISKRLPDDERKRLRSILDRVKPAEHGLIVRTAAEGATEEELRADVLRLAATWADIEKRAEQARRANQARLLYREPELAVRVIREEFNAQYRGVVIDDRRLYEDVKSYIEAMNPELADRVEFYDSEAEGLSMFERFHVHEQLHKALDRKVWLPSGGSLIIEHTEALTVIDVNTGKNVGTSNLEETVFHNNLEAADEIARQLRLRDIGGIIVIDFIDMEIRENRRKVVDAFRAALSRDKTRTQVFDISELGIVEMTRKRIGEGLLTNFADQCPTCEGRGVLIDHTLLE